MFRFLKLLYFVDLNFNKSKIASESSLRYLNVDMIENALSYQIDVISFMFLKFYILRIVK